MLLLRSSQHELCKVVVQMTRTLAIVCLKSPRKLLFLLVKKPFGPQKDFWNQADSWTLASSSLKRSESDERHRFLLSIANVNMRNVFNKSIFYFKQYIEY